MKNDLASDHSNKLNVVMHSCKMFKRLICVVHINIHMAFSVECNRVHCTRAKQMRLMLRRASLNGVCMNALIVYNNLNHLVSVGDVFIHPNQDYLSCELFQILC